MCQRVVVHLLENDALLLFKPHLIEGDGCELLQNDAFLFGILVTLFFDKLTRCRSAGRLHLAINFGISVRVA